MCSLLTATAVNWVGLCCNNSLSVTLTVYDLELSVGAEAVLA